MYPGLVRLFSMKLKILSILSSATEENMEATLKDKFNSLLHEAMKSKDEVARDTMRMVLTNLKLAEVEK